MGVRRGGRRSEGFAVRRWLQLGAASAGVGAGLLCFSLLGPQVGTAAADTAGESSTTSSASGSDGDTPSASTDAADGTEQDAKDTDQDADDQDADDQDADDQDADDQDADDEGIDTDIDGEDTEGEVAADEQVDDSDNPGPDDASAADDAASAVSNSSEAVAPEAKSQPQARSVAPRASVGSWSEVTGRAIDNWTSSSQGWINSLPVDNQAKYHVEGALWTARRTFLNQAPSVAPVQISGKVDGPVVGNVGAIDPDGDRLIYVVTRGPRSGSVHLNADGTYTYTPGADFNGVDTFRVLAVDVGPHINLVDPFRAVGAHATNLVNQRAIRFEFSFVRGQEHWTPERVQALQTSADDLVEYFLVTSPVVLAYDVTGMEDEKSSVLASAYSDLISEEPGFWPTVVQHKMLTGADANGAAADGEIEWNFGSAWALGDTVGPGEFDFISTAMHEVVHSFGFSSRIRQPGHNVGDNWSVFAGFVVTRDRARPFDSDFRWNTDFDPALTGGDGGLFFGGVNAVSAYGGFVPLFTPDPWESGSSMGHLDDRTFTGTGQKLMNAVAEPGLGIRVLSPFEIGILRDLGYRVSAPLVRL
ncbi:Ig-like domain-containing protein [Mycolicibacterium baixiangningiae]|uniref:Ig-like domain-containing protein n=1 Tax=Mycolicibacterium baixiangningiae TaxID=2761578 RepID=UPI0018662AED|nr:Ig-like domain-containing protein [Mycolicibacterium baixiangningiae]